MTCKLFAFVTFCVALLSAIFISDCSLCAHISPYLHLYIEYKKYTMQVDSSNELAIGNLLLRAGSNEIVKRVISVFDHSAKRSANVKSISTFNLDMLEPCAEFLNIALADSEENKLYTKDSLVNRIQFELRALLPSECLECNETYIVEFEAEQKPVFRSCAGRAPVGRRYTACGPAVDSGAANSRLEFYNCKK